jgi:branched-chain amino acid transport system permease protein
MGSWLASNLGLIKTILAFALLAASVQVVMRAGVFSLASVGFWAIGAYATAIMVKSHDVPYVVALIASVAACAVLGGLLAIPLRRLRGLYLGMATAAFDLVIVVAAVNGGDLTGGALGLYAIPVKMTWMHLLGAVVLVAFLLERLERGVWGRRFEALRLDEQLARSIGTSAVRTHQFAFVLSACFGALSGGMFALTFNTISPDQFGFELIVLMLTMVIVGGVGSWKGAYVGALLIGALPVVLGSFNRWKDVAYGVLLVVMTARAPDGVVGLVSRATRAALARLGRAGTPLPAPQTALPSAPVATGVDAEPLAVGPGDGSAR